MGVYREFIELTCGGKKVCFRVSHIEAILEGNGREEGQSTVYTNSGNIYGIEESYEYITKMLMED